MFAKGTDRACAIEHEVAVGFNFVAARPFQAAILEQTATSRRGHSQISILNCEDQLSMLI